MAEEGKWYIYLLVDPRYGSPRYIGYTIDPKKRYDQHLSTCHREKNHKAYWLRKLLASGRKPAMEIVEVGTGPDWESRERYWIATYRAIGCELTNTTEGGAGGVGFQIPEEARKKVEAIYLERYIQSDEQWMTLHDCLRYLQIGKNTFLNRILPASDIEALDVAGYNTRYRREDIERVAREAIRYPAALEN